MAEAMAQTLFRRKGVRLGHHRETRYNWRVLTRPEGPCMDREVGAGPYLRR